MTPLRFLSILLILFLVGCGSVALYVNSVVSTGLPSLEQLENPKQNLATQVISADGKVLDLFAKDRRVRLPLDSIPKNFINALIATEDKDFRDHWGVSAERVIKAAVKTILYKVLGYGRQEGASTITMQLARNLFLNHDNRMERKIREAFVAVQIEKTYTKEEILEMYINTVPMGRGAYGLNVASRVYFDKSPQELTLAECALLVAIIKTPERYNDRNVDLGLARRNLVLRLMHDQGYIGSEYGKALKEQINFKTGKWTSRDISIAPHFVEMIRQKLHRGGLLAGKGINLYEDGLTIYTTIDTRIQQYANEAVEEHLLEFQKLFERNWRWKYNRELLNDFVSKAIKARADYKEASKDMKKRIAASLRKDKKFLDSLKNILTTIQTGLVVIDPASGAIRAMVGASPKFMKEHNDAKYSLNHATQIRRQPGSSFKPFVYSLVVQQGVPTDTLIECGPFSFETVTGEIWSPRGTGGCEEGGKISLRDGLRRSINTVAARLITEVTSPAKVVSLLRRAGIKSNIQAVPAIALGAGGEVTPLELTSAYSIFVFNGYHVEPWYIDRIEDNNGNIIYQKKDSKQVRDALETKTTHTMTGLLSNVIQHGTGWRVKQFFTGVDCAGKTGTTNDNTDTWFVGYTPELVAGCWVGFDDMRVSFGEYGEGGKAAAPIWGRLMGKIYDDKTLPYKKKKFDFMLKDTSEIVNQTFFNDSTINTEASNSNNARKFPRLRPENN